MRKVIGYIRVSTNNQDLERQRVLIKKYCEERAYVLVGIEEDFAISGTVANRDGLNRILTVTKAIADMVVVSELSRLSRQDEVFETLTQIHTIIRNVDLVILDEPDKVYEAGKQINLPDFLMLAIKAYGAADERKKIVSRMTSGKEVKVLAFPMMLADSNIPFGFKIVPNPDFRKGATPKMLLEEDPEKMEAVRDIFNCIIEGYSLQQTADKLNNMGYRSQRNMPFNTQAVRYILYNKIYNGTRVWKGYEIPIPVKYISDEVWNLAHLQIKKNRNYNGEAQTYFNPLKGIMKCPCGKNTMICRTSSCLTYRCVEKAVEGTDSNCPNHGIKVDLLVDAVWKDIRYRTLDNSYKAKSNEKVEKLELEIVKLSNNLKLKDVEIEKLNKDIDTIVANIATSTNARIVTALNQKADEIDRYIKDLEAEKENITKAIAVNRRRITDEIKSLSRKELNELSIEGKAVKFRETLDKVVYYSESFKYGFIVNTYKNGLETVIAYRNTKTPLMYALPAGFSFNHETRKVRVEIIKKEAGSNPFEIPKTVFKEYTLNELIKTCDLEDWKI